MSKDDQQSGSPPRITPIQTTTAIEFSFPETTPVYYARLMAAQVDQHEIMVSFFDPRVPVFTGTQADILRQASNVKSVRADCLAKVIVAPERLAEFIQVLQTAMLTYEQLYASKK